MSTDCESVAQLFECEAARCVAELALTGKAATSNKPGRKLVLAHEKFKLNRGHDPDDPLGAGSSAVRSVSSCEIATARR